MVTSNNTLWLKGKNSDPSRINKLGPKNAYIDYNQNEIKL